MGNQTSDIISKNEYNLKIDSEYNFEVTTIKKGGLSLPKNINLYLKDDRIILYKKRKKKIIILFQILYIQIIKWMASKNYWGFYAVIDNKLVKLKFHAFEKANEISHKMLDRIYKFMETVDNDSYDSLYMNVVNQ